MTLTRAELIERSGLEAAAVDELVDIGVTARASEPFEAGDVQRVITAGAFVAAGFSVDHLRSAIESQTIGFGFADALDLEPTDVSSLTLADLAARLGEPVARLRALYGAFGLPLPSGETPLRQGEADVVSAFVEGWRVAGPEATLRAARLFGDGARRASEGWVQLFVEQVSMPAMARHSTFEQYADSTLRPAAKLAALAPRLLSWLQLRHSSRAMLDANLRHFERDLVGREVIPEPPHGHPVIAFADVVEFTRTTADEGDARAVEMASQLQELAESAAARHHGRVVKLLGDGAMFRFDTPDAAAGAMLELASDASASALGALHIGIERGPLIERDGDVFGATVNLAARIAGVAGSGEVLAGPAAAQAVAEHGRFSVAPIGERELKGFPAPVAIWRVQSADGT